MPHSPVPFFRRLALLLLLLPAFFLGAADDEGAPVRCDTSRLVAGRFPIPRQRTVSTKSGGAPTPNYIGDYSALENALVQGWNDLATEIDITALSISVDDIQDLYYNILNLHGECFHVDWFSYYSRNGYITRLRPTYLTTDAATIAAMRQQLEAATAKALAQLRPGMTDLEKALVLHDYLAANCEYDYTLALDHIRDAYGPLVLKRAVCAGYAIAYAHLLRRAGIPADYIVSDYEDHAWNAVQIDGKWYHVDVTWDDGDTPERFHHGYFLLSDSRLKNNPGYSPHRMWDYPAYGCTSTRFDSYFWRNAADGALPCIDGQTYAIKDGTGELYAYIPATGKGSRVCRLPEETWYVWGSSTSYYTSPYNCLAAFNGMLVFNGRDDLYLFNPLDGTYAAIPAELPSNGYRYGVRVDEGTSLYAVTRQAPNGTPSYTKINWTKVTSVAVSPAEKAYTATGTSATKALQLSATVSPASATCKFVQWRSDNEAVATVASNGKVTVHLAARGTATITATAYDGGFQAHCDITVENPVYDITLAASPNEGGRATGGGTYELGVAVTLVATPETGYDFTGWYNGNTLLSTSATYSFAAAASIVCTARFALHPCAITAASSADGQGTVSGAETFPYGTAVTLVATPAFGHDFLGWYQGDTLVSTDLEYTFTATGDAAFTARFQPHPYAIELALARGWNLIGLPFDLDADSDARIRAEILFLPDGKKTARRRVTPGTPLPGGTVLWLYHDGSPCTLPLTGTCSPLRAVPATSAVTPIMSSALPDAALLKVWNAYRWDPAARIFTPATSLAPGEAVLLATPPRGNILPVE